MRAFSCFIILHLCSYSLAHAKSLLPVEDGVVQQEPHNIVLKDNNDLKVDFVISEDDYEIFSKHRTKGLRIINEDKLFQGFDLIASGEYERIMAKNRVDVQIKNVVSESSMIMKKINNRTLLNVTLPLPRSPMTHTRKRNATDEKVEYKYLVSVYYADTISNETYTPVDIGQPECGFLDYLKQIASFKTSHNCTEEDLKGIGIKAIQCLVAEFYTKQHDYKTLTENLCKIAGIWTVVYLVIAIPLWCTKGWCSCCLCCKFFKPHQTIQEAKNYLLLNPPGVLVTKGGNITQYEPTEREKDCYEEFGHFLRTL